MRKNGQMNRLGHIGNPLGIDQIVLSKCVMLDLTLMKLQKNYAFFIIIIIVIDFR